MENQAVYFWKLIHGLDVNINRKSLLHTIGICCFGTLIYLSSFKGFKYTLLYGEEIQEQHKWLAEIISMFHIVLNLI